MDEKEIVDIVSMDKPKAYRIWSVEEDKHYGYCLVHYDIGFVNHYLTNALEVVKYAVYTDYIHKEYVRDNSEPVILKITGLPELSIYGVLYNEVIEDINISGLEYDLNAYFIEKKEDLSIKDFLEKFKEEVDILKEEERIKSRFEILDL